MDEVSSVQIIPFYAHPHVHTVIIDDTFYDETVARRPSADDLPYSTVVVTGADTGIDNTFVRINDIGVKTSLFGYGNYDKYGQSSIQADRLFNGQTNVWFCRVLPDNATYANVVVLLDYRKGKILDELSQETGKQRLEVRFRLAYCQKPTVTNGATDDEAIQAFANTLKRDTPDPQTGYMTMPICYIRSVGRGKYGNSYSIRIERDMDAEKEYSMKMYRFSVISNGTTTKVVNQFAGSLYQTTRYKMSTLISDVLDQFATGSCPVYIYSFEKNYQQIYDFYKNIVSANADYIAASGTDQDKVDLKAAQKIDEDDFDPIFGLKLNTKTDESIPFYRNYTVRSGGAYVAPDLTIPSSAGGVKPLNLADWTTAQIGSTVVVTADPLNDGLRWKYTVIDIDRNNGNITYDDGVECYIDDDQYTGVNLAFKTGHMMTGGHDGDFQEITVEGVTREPTPAEMKILLSREYVKAFHGVKDRKILSPARVDLDFIFDANYNLTTEGNLEVEVHDDQLFSGSTILTDEDNQSLVVMKSEQMSMDVMDLNVKQAMWDLNEFRNKNGMEINPEQGAGCHLHLDCNLVGTKKIGVNYELIDIINMMSNLTGRSCSIDLGWYEIFDPVTRKRIKVTACYFLATELIPHLLREGFNRPFTYNYATLRALQRDAMLTVSGNMIRDSFRPDIDLIDWDVKELLYTNRINYYLVNNEGRVVQRAVQNTRQTDASALLEENNMRVLNKLKKGLEADCRNYLYQWNEPEARKGYTDTEMQRYRSWIGTVVQDLSIEFDANEWEQERMIMHCYVIVKFRDIVKRIILEINIQRPDYSTGGES